MSDDVKYIVDILVYGRSLNCYIQNKKLGYKSWHDEFHYETSYVNQGQNKIIFEEVKWCESGLWMLLFLPLSLIVSIIMFPFTKNIFCDGKKPYKEKLTLITNIRNNVNITISDAKTNLRDCVYILNILPTDNQSGSSNIVSVEYIKEKCSKKGVLVWIISQILWTGVFCTLLFLIPHTMAKILAFFIFAIISIVVLFNGK